MKDVREAFRRKGWSARNFQDTVCHASVHGTLQIIWAIGFSRQNSTSQKLALL